ncbi:YciI family protein [Mangrovibacterium marinum]|uniref:Uncharacterized protein YciI n=1 Tax=Mangrovibacterium marinum TaxID=1639118 RepID=A0A2T5C3R9_9BACT|nr:YciI family protein [Mangrovibacterium marinum]PTN09386.1 uncharacterized protein YciI [Mangrovibacterium marinum]
MLFLITIEYKVELAQVEPYFEPHIAFVKRYVEAGNFLLTGKKIPRTGGLILAQVESREKLITLLNEDPFMELDLADFEITEIQLSQVSPELLG